MNSVERMIRNLVQRAVVRASQALDMQTISVQTQVGHDAPEIEHFEPYGFTSNPHPGAEAIVLNVGAADHAVAIVVSDRRYRITSLEPGEVCIYDDNGSYVELGSTGITVHSSGNVKVEAAGDVTVDGARILIDGATGLDTEHIVTGTSVAAGAAGLTVAVNAYAAI